jgi:hypothetical protein
MPPITIMVESNNPSWRRGFNASDFVIPSEVEESLTIFRNNQRCLDFRST